MSLVPRRGLLPLLLLFWLCLPVPAPALGGVEDGAGLFSRDARHKADDAIEEIRQRTRKDLLIETVKDLPPEKLKEYRGLKEAERARFFRALAEERARRADVDGVYVLLFSEPQQGLARFLPWKVAGHLPQVAGHAVVVWPPANDAYFPKDDRDELDGRFARGRVVDANRDEVLLGAVAWAGDRLQANARALSAPPADSFRWTDVLWAAGGLLGTWAALGVARARVAARQGTVAPVPGANEGFLAMYGTVGGLWLFNTYLARRKEAAPPAPAPVVAESAPAPEADGIPPDGPTHPDDLEALSRRAGPWSPEGTEATTGHDLP